MDGQHLKSFWSYHQAALRWFKVHRAAREYAVNGSSEAISSSVDRKMNVIDEQFVTNNHFPGTVSLYVLFIGVIISITILRMGLIGSFSDQCYSHM